MTIGKESKKTKKYIVSQPVEYTIYTQEVVEVEVHAKSSDEALELVSNIGEAIDAIAEVKFSQKEKQLNKFMNGMFIESHQNEMEATVWEKA